MEILTKTPENWAENESAYTKHIANEEIWNLIPLLNVNDLQNLKHSTLVRFRGMVQDMYDPEYYYEKYTVVNEKTAESAVKSGKYVDTNYCKNSETFDLESSECVLSERHTLVVISAPAANDWVQHIETKKFKLANAVSSSPTSSTKRALEENEMETEETLNNQNNKKTRVMQTPSIKKPTVSSDHILNFPLVNRIGKTCHLKMYQDDDQIKLNDFCEFVGFLSVDPILSHETLESEEYNKMELETHHPPPSLIPRIHCVSWKKLPHNNPLVGDFKLPSERMRSLKTELLVVLTQLLLGDRLAAEYFLYHLLSTVAHTSHDVWQFGIVIFVCLTGCLPWQKASHDDPRYSRYLSWHTSSIPLKRQPKLFKLVSSKAQKLFRKYLEPKPEKRPAGLAEVHRFLDDRWMSKGGMEKTNEFGTEEDGLCPSMYSFHSSPEEKNKLLRTLTQYGIETTVDREAKKDRIRQWIQASVIEEEDEEEQADEVIGIRDNQTGPPGERLERGPVAEHKVVRNGNLKKGRSMSMVSLRKPEGVYTPPIDPRIPLEEQKEKTKTLVRQKKLDAANGGINNNSHAAPFAIQTALPFQNLAIKTDSQESEVNSSDSSTSRIKHRINVQMPQSEVYSVVTLSPKLPPRGKKIDTNGTTLLPVNRRLLVQSRRNGVNGDVVNGDMRDT